MHMGKTADVGPEIGCRASEDADIRCDMVFDDVGRAPRNPIYLLGTWRTSRRHVELPDGVAERHQIYNQSMQKHITNTVQTPGLRWGEKAAISSRRKQHHLNQKKNCSGRVRVQMSGVITTGPTGPD